MIILSTQISSNNISCIFDITRDNLNHQYSYRRTFDKESLIKIIWLYFIIYTNLLYEYENFNENLHKNIYEI